jgi:hypothetical protein
MRSSSNLSWYATSIIVQQKGKTQRLYVETKTTLKLVLSVVNLITLVHISTQLGSGFIIKHSFCCKILSLTYHFKRLHSNMCSEHLCLRSDVLQYLILVTSKHHRNLRTVSCGLVNCWAVCFVDLGLQIEAMQILLTLTSMTHVLGLFPLHMQSALLNSFNHLYIFFGGCIPFDVTMHCDSW